VERDGGAMPMVTGNCPVAATDSIARAEQAFPLPPMDIICE
jgi:hypothetical protein